MIKRKGWIQPILQNRPSAKLLAPQWIEWIMSPETASTTIAFFCISFFDGTDPLYSYCYTICSISVQTISDHHPPPSQPYGSVTASPLPLPSGLNQLSACLALVTMETKRDDKLCSWSDEIKITFLLQPYISVFQPFLSLLILFCPSLFLSCDTTVGSFLIAYKSVQSSSSILLFLQSCFGPCVEQTSH